MAGRDEATIFEDQITGLEDAMAAAGEVTKSFTAGLLEAEKAMEITAQHTKTLSTGLSRGLRSAFDGLIFDGYRASDALSTVARSVVNTAYSAAIRPVTSQLGGALASAVTGLFADGAAFSQGRVTPFASGGIVSGPTAFPMRGGTALMGEAGPEAIMPLTRGADGRLGVRAAGGGGGVSVVMNITTPDAQSFQRSQTQIAAQMSRALGRSQRNS
ncbi:phage tail tape measure protein [Rhodobacteraceae bacterium]|nr:phage tail tape measure protein [Paracoccaceae bacterium]